ncbi:MAG: RluA family pseudouridine synthase [Clostridia bacterium]|nr:RluA family pseudouridine synthase [Clostridia bacterium]
MDFIVDDAFGGRKLKDFLLGGLKISHALLTDLKTRGIYVNGEEATVRKLLATGDRVALAIEDTYEDCDEFLTASELALDVIYEDDCIIAVNKPPYMPTHVSRGHRDDTLANALKAEFDKRNLPFVFRAVNRLDSDTSGIVIVAKNRFAADRFAKTNTDYKKIYTAFCLGNFDKPEGEIKNYIRRVEKSIIRRAVFENGKESDLAHTRYRVKEVFGDVSVVECEPVTGRTHQLRVHFSHMGHPIVGDDFYGGGFLMKRQALHAEYLSFIHPFTGESISLHAPLPDDMSAFIERIKNEN